jgi:hypothetical protein
MAVATQNPLNLQGPPTFATLAEERQYRKQRLAGAFRLFSRFGFDEGVAGHVTARDPERPDHFWVNPFGMHFGQIRVSDLILVNDRGQVVEGKYPVNGAAFAIHSQVRRPCALPLRKNLVVARAVARSHHSGCLRIL